MDELIYLDSHCHLFSEEFAEDFEEMMGRAEEKNVRYLNIMCTEEEEAYRAMEYCERDREHITVSYGIFPTDVKDMERRWQEFEAIVSDPRIACVGEIGLDYYWEKDPAMREKQREMFVRQIETAVRLNKPICIHSRDAIQDTFDLLKEHPCRALMHSFSGSVEMGREFVKLGCFLSIGGPVTFKNARHAAEVVKDMDVSFLLTETDSPYMAPVPVRGRRNEPANIPYITAKMAELRDVPVSALAPVIIENWKRFLNRS
jgi:TatD DNase family protein